MDVGVGIIPLAGQVPAVQWCGVQTVLLSTREAPYLATLIAFVASERMDGEMLECATSVEGSLPVTETVTLQVGISSEFM